MASTPIRRLLLLRHAKSAWPDVPDHERPLAGRGSRDAPAAGRWLRESGFVPDHVLCSTARRARETWQLAAAELGTAAPVTYQHEVYEAGCDVLLDVIRGTPPEVGTLLVIGHNPSMQELALTLAGREAGGKAAGGLRRASAKFPTAAVAVLEFSGAWSHLRPARAQLIDFIVPRDLAR